MTQGVSGGRWRSSRPAASASRPGRRAERGLYSATTKSAPAAASRRARIASHGVSRSDSEIAQKSCPSGAPARAAAACIALTPGATVIADRRPVAPPFALDQLEHQRGEAVDAGVAGRDQRDRPSLGRQIEREPHPRRLFADRAVMPALAGDRTAEQVEIKPVADDFVGRREQRGRLRGPPCRIAGAGADDRQPAARAADRAGVERRGGARDRAGGAARLATRNDEHAVRPGGGERRALGHAPAAGRAKRRLRADRQPFGFREQPRGRKKPGRNPERARKIMDRRLVGLEVDRNDRGDRARREPGRGERVARQRRDFLGRDAALAADHRAPGPADGTPARCSSVSPTRSVTTTSRPSPALGPRPRAPSPAVRERGGPAPSGVGARVRVPRAVPARSQSARAASSTSITGSPASNAAAIGFTRSGFAMRQPGGGSSSAKPRRRSPAVVIAAMPPNASASTRASALAPRWPPRSGTATDPSSASATTGGSASLSESSGARRGSGCRWRTTRRSAAPPRTARATAGSAARSVLASDGSASGSGRRSPYPSLPRLRAGVQEAVMPRSVMREKSSRARGTNSSAPGSRSRTRRPSAAPPGPSTTIAAPRGNRPLVIAEGHAASAAPHQGGREIWHGRGVNRGERGDPFAGPAWHARHTLPLPAFRAAAGPGAASGNGGPA